MLSSFTYLHAITIKRKKNINKVDVIYLVLFCVEKLIRFSDREIKTLNTKTQKVSLSVMYLLPENEDLNLVSKNS